MFEWKIFSIFAEKTISLSRYASLQSEIEARPFKQSNAKDRQYASVSSRRSVNKHKLQKAWILKNNHHKNSENDIRIFLCALFYDGSKLLCSKNREYQCRSQQKRVQKKCSLHTTNFGRVCRHDSPPSEI